jgi:hypothetical protein
MADDFEKAVLITFNYGGNIDPSLKVHQRSIGACVAGGSLPQQYCTSSSTCARTADAAASTPACKMCAPARPCC